MNAYTAFVIHDRQSDRITRPMATVLGKLHYLWGGGGTREKVPHGVRTVPRDTLEHSFWTRNGILKGKNSLLKIFRPLQQTSKKVTHSKCTSKNSILCAGHRPPIPQTMKPPLYNLNQIGVLPMYSRRIITHSYSMYLIKPYLAL